MGLYVNCLPLDKTEMPGQSARVREIVSAPIRPTFGGILLGWPTVYAGFGAMAESGPRVAFTMFESTKIPEKWISILNSMDAIIVPSSFCAVSFVQCGIVKPIHIVPLGINPLYQPIARNGDVPFTFLAFLDRGKRKGYIHAMNAFLLAFGDSLDVRLILKSRATERPLRIENPNIEVVQDDMTEEELYALYGQCHALLNPHKGEGFGLIPREFAASGGIALSTNWSGTADRIAQWGIPLPYGLEKADWEWHKTLRGQPLGEWAKPDDRAIAHILREIVAERENFLSDAYRKAQWASHYYTWHRCARRVFEIWKGILDGNGD